MVGTNQPVYNNLNIYLAITGALDNNGQSTPAGINFFYQVNTPSAFTNQGGNQGTEEMVQVINSIFTQINTLSNPSNPVISQDNNALDTEYPYPIAALLPDGYYYTNDNPYLILESSTIDLVKGEYNANFSDYLLYRPPGGSSQWVPLQLGGWKWNNTVTSSKGIWTNYQGALSNPVATSPSIKNQYPNWQNVYIAP